ncbi:hypothetical protein HanPSC8_Chr04g0143711 [Helianthus annuus]|nr:hypothetical protein HanPSC8_Chr04g0143711 [Helianthus annuus]
MHPQTHITLCNNFLYFGPSSFLPMETLLIMLFVSEANIDPISTVLPQLSPRT